MEKIMSTKTDQVKAKLAKKPNPTPEEIKEWAKDIGCSPSLVYKWKAKLPESVTRAVEAGQPVVSVEEEAEIIIEEPAEGEAFEVPSEFIGEKEKPVEEAPVEEEIVIEEEAKEAEEERLLRDISKRAIKRFFGVAIEEGLGLGKQFGLNDQEAEDSEILLMLFVAKYAMIEVKENLLEITGGLHFGSIGLRLLVGWIKKRREEAKKKEKEKPVEKPAEVPAEEKPAEEKPLTTEKEAREDAEAEREKRIKEAERAYLKKIGGGM